MRRVLAAAWQVPAAAVILAVVLFLAFMAAEGLGAAP